MVAPNGYAPVRPPDKVKQMRSSEWSVNSGKGGGGTHSSIYRAAHAARKSPSAAMAMKYSPQRNANTGTNVESVRSSILSQKSSTTPQERFQNMKKANNRGGGRGGGYNTPEEESRNTGSFDSLDVETMETDLYKQFEEAFAVTIKNNPGILPGAPNVIESIKTAMFKAQKSKAAKEAELRKQLDQVKSDMINMEHKLNKQISEIAMKKTEFLTQMKGMESVKKDLEQKFNGTAAEKEQLAKNLAFLSKSRKELEKALEAEVKKVEKDRDALKKVVAERKKIEKVNEENKSLEDEVLRMSEEANKQNEALNEKKDELKELEEKNQILRIEYETTQEKLEKEQQQILEMTKAIQAKKSALLESKDDLERQSHELERQMVAANLASPNLSYVMRNFGDGAEHLVDGALSACMGVQDVASVRGQKSLRDVPPLADSMSVVKSSSEIKDRQDAEKIDYSMPEINVHHSLNPPVASNVNASSDDDSDASKERRRRKRNKRKEGKRRQEEEDKMMKREIDNLRMELEAVRARNNINLRNEEARDAEDARRDQLEFLRSEIRVNKQRMTQERHRDRDYSHFRRGNEHMSSPASRRYPFEDDERPSLRTSPASSRYNLGEDDRPSRRRFDEVDVGFSRRSSPYSDRFSRSTPESHRSRRPWE